MNKRGFTLTELLGVIVVLAIIIGIAGMSALTIIGKSRNKANEEMLENLKDVAVTYALENDVDDIDINANTLIDEGLFDDDKGKCRDVKLHVEYSSEDHEYKVNVVEGNCKD